MNMRSIAACLGCYVLLTCTQLSADVVQQWNQVLSETLKANVSYQNPGMASRSLAMTNIAMYDAMQGIQPTHTPFYTHGSAPANASLEAAVVQAGYRVLSSIYPDQQSLLDTHRNAIFASLPDPAMSISAGVGFGDAVGDKVIQERMNDGYMNMVPYMPTNVVGHWQPDPLNPAQMAWGPEWGELKPFAVSDMNAMMPPAMPALTSQEYSDAFNEVKSLGELNSTTRTADQTEAGLFWAYDRVGIGTPMRLYIDVLDTISTQEGNSLSDNALLYAMASTSVADAGIVAWDAKFQYDFWRPISGIRQADQDGNPDTIIDPDWIPLGAPGGIHPDGSLIDDFTPPFPTYISGHASFGGALFGAIEEFYGTNDIAFPLESEELPGVTRHFDSLSDAMAENGRSRVYLGIHWDFDDFMARDVGKVVADDVMQNYFSPVPEPETGLLVLLGGLFGLSHRKRRRTAS